MQFRYLFVMVCFGFLVSCTTNKNPITSDFNRNSSNSDVNSNFNSPTPGKKNPNTNPEIIEQPVNADILKQVEEQQKETMRLNEERIKAAGSNTNAPNNNNSNSNIAPKITPPKSNVPPAQRRTT